MRAPPPIVSRIFQELSNGLLAYNNATKMKAITPALAPPSRSLARPRPTSPDLARPRKTSRDLR